MKKILLRKDEKSNFTSLRARAERLASYLGYRAESSCLFSLCKIILPLFFSTFGGLKRGGSFFVVY